MQKELLDKIIEDLEKVDHEILNGTQWSQSVKLNKVIVTLKEYRDKHEENSNNV